MDKEKRILIVEDDPLDVELIIKSLEDNKLEKYIYISHNGEEALNYLFHREEFSGKSYFEPCFVILDLKMPKVDGFDVLQQLKSDEKLKDLPVIILTSSQETEDIEKCYKFGANAYVIKPIEYKDFQRVVKVIGDFWSSINKPSPNIYTDFSEGYT